MREFFSPLLPDLFLNDDNTYIKTIISLQRNVPIGRKTPTLIGFGVIKGVAREYYRTEYYFDLYVLITQEY